MTRLSLHDKSGPALERRLPICRICCKLFASNDTEEDSSRDKRLAAFAPCGHVFHYRCILERIERMEDSCNCATCFTRMEDNAPIILYMEWSKNAKPVPLEETEEIEIVTAPDADSIRLREEVGIMKLKHESLCDQKEQLLRLLNDVSDSVGNGRSTCEALDSICGQITERIGSTSVSLSRETKVCDELASRIQRDKNKSIIGEVAERISLNHDEFQIMEFLQSQLSQSGDPDDLLTSFSSYYDHCHKRLKRELKSVAQLKSVVHSLKKEITETEQRLVIAERAKKIPVAQKPAPLKKHKPLVVDRKVSIPKPLSAVNTEYADDDLARSRVRASTFFN